MKDEVGVKICGVCRVGDAEGAVRAGADYVGVILASGFARTRSLAEAAAILAGAEGAERVGVFVGDDARFVIDAAERLRLGVLQLHGDESEEVIMRLRAAGPWKVWKTLRVRDAERVEDAARTYAGLVDGILIDGWSERGAGGVGASFDWKAVVPQRRGLAAGADLIAAGGLVPENVSELIGVLSPDVVDVSSGVEEAPGCKSAERMRAFVRAARGVAAG